MKNIHKLFLVLTLLAGAPAAMGQYGFGTNSPAASAAVDVSSTTKGFLPPRMTDAQIAAIPNPATGLVVFNTTTRLLVYSVGGAWVNMAPLTNTSLTTGTPTISLSGTVLTATVNGVPTDATVDYQWYAADEENGTNEFLIPGAVLIQYVSTAVDCGRWVSVHTTCVQNGTVGLAQSSARAKPVPVYSSLGYYDTDGKVKLFSYGVARYNGRCWLTQNLGSVAPATTKTPTSQGVFYRFGSNVMYNEDYDCSTLTAPGPGVTFDPIDNPCTRTLGNQWRIPTSTEWGSPSDKYSQNSYGGVLLLGNTGWKNSFLGIDSACGLGGRWWMSDVSNRADGQTIFRYIETSLQAGSIIVPSMNGVVSNSYVVMGSLRCVSE